MALDQDVVSTTESIDTAAAGRPVQVVGDTPAPPTSTGLVDLTDSATGSPMQVRKRDGSLEPVDLNKIVRAVARCAVGLDNVDPMRVATRTISGLVDHSSTEELDELSIRTAAALISEEPNYSRLAARLLATVIDKEVQNQDIYSFSQSVAMGHAQGIIGDETAAMVATNARKLNDAVLADRNWLYEFFGLRTVYDRYLLRHPESRRVVETPQYFLLRVACGLSRTPEEAIEFYELISSLEYLPSSPTLFNSGTAHPQMSSCYLLDSPEDNLDAIYDRYRDVARLSKHAGGIGLSYSRVRSRGSLIRGTNGLSNGIVPWLKTLDSSVAAVNQGGRRKGAACVYLETWHADIEEFLELRDNVGDTARRTLNLNLANWVPDLFMERVEKDWQWSLF
ncbi:MAG TPA: ribonucleotide reductase N-terminal alpha domain-containing protein, partial [Microthrixaceae bacterium]|nr:ribonucleotide reductase N-terminal alpha domain-containing protein [Microthrixaceae bacterium]